jgi:hypothetical protein
MTRSPRGPAVSDSPAPASLAPTATPQLCECWKTHPNWREGHLVRNGVCAACLLPRYRR